MHMKEVILVFVLSSLLLPFCLEGQESPPDAIGEEMPADTTYLEAVSISVMPFRESYLEASGSVFAVRKEEIQREFSLV